VTECAVCTAKTPDTFLCSPHIGELRDNLRCLAQGPENCGGPTAGLLDNLADVVLKRTRLGSGGGHRKRGDEMPALFVPDVGKMVKDKTTGEDTDQPILSPQGRAAELLIAARNQLTTIVRDICETRGIAVMAAFGVVPADFIGPLQRCQKRAHGEWCPATSELAAWLAQYVHTIACDESAGQWWAEVDHLVRSIERLIDRPVKIELLGFCWTERDGTACDTALRAPEDAIEVRCRKCHTLRRCDIVRRNGQNDARRKLITWNQVLDTNRQQPDGWKVNERTLRDWRSTGVLKPQQYRRTDGTQGINRHSDADEPLYKWDDVERVRSKPRSERKRTRAGR
jgi:hypothetical protein